MNSSETGHYLLGYTSISNYQQQLADRTTTCVQVVKQYIDRIQSRQHLNAFTEIFDTAALERAAVLDLQLDNGHTMLALHGVVIAIKDVLCYKGYRVTAASRILGNFQSIYSATAVQRLTDAGAIIIGSCNCDEFAMGSTNENSAYGPVLNAIDNEHVPGGSSGGSAVAVQADMCMVSLGSDTGGSVRQPADFCGIFGLKPTYGRISRYGLIAYASSFDQVGIFGKNVADVARVLEVIAGADEADGTCSKLPVASYSAATETDQRIYKFAYLTPTMDLPGLDPEIKLAIEGLFDQLRANGHEVTGIPFPLLDHIVPAYYILTTAEASSNLGRFDGARFGRQDSNVKLTLTEFYKYNRTNGFGKEVKRRIMLGTFVLSAGYYDAYFTKAQKVRRLIFEQTEAIFTNFDAILMPVSPSTAFKLGEKMTDPVAMYLADIYTVFANLAGIPALAIPGYKHSNGMPFGIQVLTNRFEEVSLHRISEMLSTTISMI
ncbi:MAG: Asp-tRNA(Asn)/Glu-tRNA(Gln) amidotransferase subunit GatA [Chitinophagaceae bacterium]